MSKKITKKIEKLELVKIEKIFNNPELKFIYHYNLFLEGIEEPLLISNPNQKIEESVEGKTIKFKFNEENLISDFELI
jgi:hypothetical protein